MSQAIPKPSQVNHHLSQWIHCLSYLTKKRKSQIAIRQGEQEGRDKKGLKHNKQ